MAAADKAANRKTTMIFISHSPQTRRFGTRRISKVWQLCRTRMEYSTINALPKGMVCAIRPYSTAIRVEREVQGAVQMTSPSKFSDSGYAHTVSLHFQRRP
jgi:hypothetical protein